MTTLAGIVVTTPDLVRLRDFFERGLGLRVAHAGADGVTYATRGATLALAAGDATAIQLRLATPDFDRRMLALAQRTGGAPKSTGAAGARRATLSAPGGLAIVIEEGVPPVPAGDVALSHTILESDDLDAELRFWREVIGFRLAEESEHTLRFEAGAAALAVHQRGAATGPPLHPDQRAAFALEWDDLDAAADAVRGRGFALATAPSEEAFGRYAEIEDPDGMIVVMRGPGVDEPIEEALAEEWADDDDDEDGLGGRRMRERENPGTRRVAKPASQQRTQQRKAAEKASTRAFEDVPHGRAPGRGNYPPAGGASRPPRPDGGFTPRPSRPDGGFAPRPPRPEGGFAPRPPRPEGGFAPRPPRPDGGFTPRPPRPEGGPPSRPPGGGSRGPAPGGRPPKREDR